MASCSSVKKPPDADFPPEPLDVIVTVRTMDDPTYPDYVPLPTLAQLEKHIDQILPPDEEMDEVSATVILDREGVELGKLVEDLKGRVGCRIEESRTRLSIL